MNRDNKRNEIENKYGHLLDKYLDNVHVDFKTEQERKIEAKRRYGDILDKTGNPLSRTYKNVCSVDDACVGMKKQMEEEYDLHRLRIQERIEREKREEQERQEGHKNFINTLEEKKEARCRAEEEKRRKAREEKEWLDQIQNIIDTKSEVSKMIASGNAMIERYKKAREEHKRQMAFYGK